MKKLFWGRRLLEQDLFKIKRLPSTVKKLKTMSERNNAILCLRCGTLHNKIDVMLPMRHANSQAIYYCPACIQMGRVQSNQAFYYLPQPKKVFQKNYILNWSGKLSIGQQKISEEILQAAKEKRSHLVWAVTGAGKTEMLFSALIHYLNKGWRICVAAPRIDVCLELYPRFKEVFPDTPLMLLYGKQSEQYRYTPFVVCTTHQLMRFYRSFDLLILDEADAYPFYGNSCLKYALHKALKQTGTLIYLTATPDASHKKQVEEGSLATSILPARYHRRPLPQPIVIWVGDWQRKVSQQKLSKVILKELVKSFQAKQKVLLFCPQIDLMRKLLVRLHAVFPDKQMTFVHAADPQREQKVLAMRNHEYDLLLTTTILERGVTLTNIDVMVVAANHRVFTAATLVQIAGRAGRKVSDVNGRVIFFHDGLSRAIKQACQQVKKMNEIALSRRLIDQ